MAKFDPFLQQQADSTSYSASVDLDRHVVVFGLSDCVNTIFVTLHPETAQNIIRALQRACAFIVSGKDWASLNPSCGHAHEAGWTCFKPRGHTDMHSNGDHSWEK